MMTCIRGILFVMILSMSCALIEARSKLILGIGAGYTGIGLITLYSEAVKLKQILKLTTEKNDASTVDHNNKKVKPVYILSGMGNLLAGTAALYFEYNLTT
ncbi:MAG TPA: hypothetical protein VFF04_01835 [Candidatus Babeliales bacterium]|nr:hypothetical protein [Candidatus Babeliales bacterium]